MQRKSKDKLKNNDNIGNVIKSQIEKIDSKKIIEKKLDTKKSKVTSTTKTEDKNITVKNTNTENTAKSNSNKMTLNSIKLKNPSSSKAITYKAPKKDLISDVEYYDLPSTYNETVVKILAQTPTTLFIYWDISDSDKKLYIERYGEDFFNTTKPILIVRNKTMNYSFEVEINDFANSWYLHVNDANCDYSVELVRRPIKTNSKINDYVYLSTSNNIQMPNNRILFDNEGKSVFFKNVKNDLIKEMPMGSISFIKRLGKFYNIYELYKEIYKNEINIEDLSSDNIRLDLSSSNSSTFM